MELHVECKQHDQRDQQLRHHAQHHMLVVRNLRWRSQRRTRPEAQHQRNANARREDHDRLAQRIETAIARQHGRHHVRCADIAICRFEIGATDMAVRRRSRIAIVRQAASRIDQHRADNRRQHARHDHQPPVHALGFTTRQQDRAEQDDRRNARAHHRLCEGDIGSISHHQPRSTRQRIDTHQQDGR